jgi:phytoene synthase
VARPACTGHWRGGWHDRLGTARQRARGPRRGRVTVDTEQDQDQQATGVAVVPSSEDQAVLDRLDGRVAGQEETENVPVAPWFVRPDRRRHLRALYRFARFVDDVGDEPDAGIRDDAGRRTELLLHIDRDLDRLTTGRARLPAVAGLQATVSACALPLDPLHALVRANLQDQVVRRYDTFAELVGYCDLSARPVGDLVLHVYGAATPERLPLAADVCTALQLVEHCQDVAEDLRRGRVYLPAEDLARFGVTEEDLAADSAGAGVRRLIAFELDRAEALLDAGSALVGTLRGEARLLTAGFVGGGRAAIGAIRAVGHDVLAAAPRPTRRQVAIEAVRALLDPRPGAGRRRRVAAAYRECERITREQARNFSYGIRLLPPGKRRALSAVYAFARRIDDIGDDTVLGTEEKTRLLTAVRAQLGALDDHRDDPVSVALADAAARMPIPLAAFLDLVDGVEMDVRGTVYRTSDDLVRYCERVAGSIGRLSLGVFGTGDPAGSTGLANALGVALQLTNILRDIREDLENGRVYLPRQDLAEYGITLDAGDPSSLTRAADRLPDLVRHEASWARGWYEVGLRLVPRLDRRSAACCLAMAGIYSRLLDRIAAEPGRVLEGRVTLPAREKLLVAVRALARGAR